MKAPNLVLMDEFARRVLIITPKAHGRHWLTSSMARHLGLETIYQEIGAKLDPLVEAFMGKYGVLKLDQPLPEAVVPRDDLTFLETLAQWIETNKAALAPDTWVQNGIDAILELVYVAIFRLKYLR